MSAVVIDRSRSTHFGGIDTRPKHGDREGNVRKGTIYVPVRAAVYHFPQSAKTKRWSSKTDINSGSNDRFKSGRYSIGMGRNKWNDGIISTVINKSCQTDLAVVRLPQTGS